MPKIKKDLAPALIDDDTLEGRYAELGPFTVAFETFHVDADPAPLFRGLPEDRCQCEHWGQVRSGKLIYRYPDHEEEFVTGDFYYAAPGHLPLVTSGTEVAEFTRTEELSATMGVVQSNMAKEGAGQ
ncbi:MAG: cupin domain-containing protein [Actinomycetota bacterium]|nr:cupin domain-containing protein [Actinomycetota bacterium]